MIIVPPFLLKRLYVKHSLHNNGDGFQFELHNTLGSGYGTEICPLVVDGAELPRDGSFFVIDGNAVPFAAVNKERPFTLPMNKKIVIAVKGASLRAGIHKIGFNFVAKGLGKLGFEVSDNVAAP